MEKLHQLQEGQSFQHQLLEEIDKEFIDAWLEAEKQCQKIKAGGVAWCPLVTQAIQAIQYWKGWLKQAKGGSISNNVLQKRA